MPDNLSYTIIGIKGVMIQRTQSRCDLNAFEISFEEKISTKNAWLKYEELRKHWQAK